MHLLFDGPTRPAAKSDCRRNCRTDYFRAQRCLRSGGEDAPRNQSAWGWEPGEPFLNFDELMKAIRILKEPDGLHIVANRITVSTAGIVPRIRELATTADRPRSGYFAGRSQ